MRRTIFTSLFLLSACSAPEHAEDNQSLKTFDVQEAPPPQSRVAAPPTVMEPAPPPEFRSADMAAQQGGGPNINVSSAPGVAFSYRYAFRLPNSRISAAQEAHAIMCEKLGVTRCRITGMRYSVVNERDVSASLELKLDPAIARTFGKDATKVITDAEGMLVDQEISGADAGSSIERANRGRAELQDELDRVNGELSRSGLSSVVRDRLLSEAASLRSQIRSLGEQKAADEDSLAKTPMAFYYGSGRTIPGFDEPAPLRDAFARAAYNFLSALGFLIIALATLLPWIVLAALGVWAYRRWRPRSSFGEAGYRAAEAEPASTTPARPARREKKDSPSE
ncbi:MAG TPA: hypothetical protein VFH89_08725 [Sphingomicrobium sp.]|nr:hypothetical protein [Sphingomicrobium sp.]